jgi:hypothetical protein
MVFPLFSALAVWQGAQADVQMPGWVIVGQELRPDLVRSKTKKPSFVSEEG